MNTLHQMIDVVSREPRDKTAMLVAADAACEEGLLGLEFLLRYLSHPDREPFLFAGSRVYGTPREDSDWDWVYTIPVRSRATCCTTRLILARGGTRAGRTIRTQTLATRFMPQCGSARST